MSIRSNLLCICFQTTLVNKQQSIYDNMTGSSTALRFVRSTKLLIFLTFDNIFINKKNDGSYFNFKLKSDILIYFHVFNGIIRFLFHGELKN